MFSSVFVFLAQRMVLRVLHGNVSIISEHKSLCNCLHKSHFCLAPIRCMAKFLPAEAALNILEKYLCVFWFPLLLNEYLGEGLLTYMVRYF